ncbi:MAG: hypothetical protein JNM30_10445 [Rhodospirillales bacterium]|nr:hypothetical protein [Rhodospirillales bacterium]
MPPKRIKAVLRAVERGLTVTVFLVEQDRDPVFQAEDFVDTFDEAEGLANRHAIRLGIPLRDVIIEES